jgi:hypothetical protein
MKDSWLASLSEDELKIYRKARHAGLSRAQVRSDIERMRARAAVPATAA